MNIRIITNNDDRLEAIDDTSGIRLNVSATEGIELSSKGTGESLLFDRSNTPVVNEFERLAGKWLRNHSGRERNA